jgi:hypothetical protein
MGTIAIPLTQGKQAIIDEEDWPLVGHLRWYAVHARTRKTRSPWYAANHSTQGPEGKRPILFMHRLILGVEPGVLVDHRNGDGLDNRRGNLRGASASQNKANSARYTTTASGYKGVYATGNKRHPWCAQIRGGGGTRQIGVFATAQEAAAAYDEAAQRVHGEFARPNTGFLEERTDPCIVTQSAPRGALKVTNRTGFNGVWGPHPQTGRYRASICHAGKSRYIGYYATPEEAARAYDAKAKELLGSSAHLNFPQD